MQLWMTELYYLHWQVTFFLYIILWVFLRDCISINIGCNIHVITFTGKRGSFRCAPVVQNGKGMGTTLPSVISTPASSISSSSATTTPRPPGMVTPQRAGNKGLSVAAIMAIALGSFMAVLTTLILLTWMALKLGVRLNIFVFRKIHFLEFAPFCYILTFINSLKVWIHR